MRFNTYKDILYEVIHPLQQLWDLSVTLIVAFTQFILYVDRVPCFLCAQS